MKNPGKPVRNPTAHGAEISYRHGDRIVRTRAIVAAASRANAAAALAVSEKRLLPARDLSPEEISLALHRPGLVHALLDGTWEVIRDFSDLQTADTRSA
ncbi:hypothetical protein CKO28_04875 [Rhodovibrio sodomensis]|uniref:Uncharacterized protein n=1 Tax=Rhodovibrio sodomensis TaxID=1088 RepID=A0ABS1DAA5_9PROT|nr:hypothetical protein [Rhodovibrio sodomensis]MBK1667362.1 hypothetical protein [Rhodovibrio sodomensis]